MPVLLDLPTPSPFLLLRLVGPRPFSPHLRHCSSVGSGTASRSWQEGRSPGPDAVQSCPEASTPALRPPGGGGSTRRWSYVILRFTSLGSVATLMKIIHTQQGGRWGQREEVMGEEGLAASLSVPTSSSSTQPDDIPAPKPVSLIKSFRLVDWTLLNCGIWPGYLPL